FGGRKPVTPAYQALKRGIDRGKRRAELVRDHGAEIPIKIRCGPLPGQGRVEFLGARLHQLLQMVAMIGNLPLGRPPLGNVRNQQDHADDASAVTQREAAQVDIERFRLIKWKERLVQQSNSLALKGIADRLLDPVDLEEAGQLAQRGTRGPVSTKVEQTFGGFVPDRAAL